MNFPLLQEKTAAEGKIFGVDLSEAMLKRSEKRIVAAGWKNVELIHSSAADYAFPDVVEGIIATAVLVWFVLSGATSGMHRSVVSAFWAKAYGVRHLGAIRSLVSSVSVVGTAISPVLFGWMIDDGASMELIAAICVIWIALAIPATWFGLRYSAAK